MIRNYMSGIAMKQVFIAAFTVASLSAAPAFADPATDALAKQVDELAKQVRALQGEVKKLQSQNEALANQIEAQPATPAATATAGSAASTGALSRASLFGYGEINYSHYDHDSAATQMDLRRAVFGIGYRFDDRTRFVSEFEVEHAIASSGDEGEFEVEQFYLDHRFGELANLKTGLFLIPMGLLNESHEPTRYYGVERNFVETAIIPTTWREGGVGVYGNVAGVRWDVGLTTGFNLSNWDFASDAGIESPLGAVHQELQLARASDLAQYASLNYNGVPGFNVGASVFTGGAGQSQSGIEDHPRVTLWEAHTRWTPGALDLSALYARGVIGGAGSMNAANLAQPAPIPDSFHGWYVQGAYRVWQRGAHSLSPFTRYERFNTAASYPGQPLGLGTEALPTETVNTYGVNFYLNPNVVFKADYQSFHVDGDRDRFDLGLGLAF
jgi:hypothetical protein